MDNEENMRILRDRMKDPEFKRKSLELYDALVAAANYENKYKAMTNIQLAEALINGPWADTPLFSEFSELMEVIADRLMRDGE